MRRTQQRLHEGGLNHVGDEIRSTTKVEAEDSVVVINTFRHADGGELATTAALTVKFCRSNPDDYN